MEVMMMGRAPMLRSEEGYMEKRQLFLRSYHFSRKRTTMDRIRRSLVRVRCLILVRLRTARRLPFLVWCRLRLKLRCLCPSRRRQFQRLLVNPRPLACNTDCWPWSSIHTTS
ncbi:uncharacterized protein LOC120254398 [Dioscorea cayenensis subsp. rotundata]|uniref:Uncharacterized protein LOC120254398 n=1 Tax=Dioscorea cayennensis subsp. rotundata TaxID=55577 RepID=A0AB40AUZ1_DIOCR|nr:uncharacterized protein LOC120254398 [Dioscorea cayenensis subsp. rotundata]